MSFAAAAARPCVPQGPGPCYAQLAQKAVELARTPPATYLSSAIPGDLSAEQRKGMVPVLVACLEDILRERGVTLRRDALRPYTVDLVPASGGALTAPQQYAFQVTSSTPRIKEAFSASLRTCDFPSHNLSLSFRPMSSASSSGFRALLIGYSPYLPTEGDLLGGLLKELFAWNVARCARVHNPHSRIPVPTDKVTVFINGRPPASWEEAPKSFLLGNKRILVRYPGVEHLADGPRTAPAPPPAQQQPQPPAGGTVQPQAAPTVPAQATEPEATPQHQQPRSAEPQAPVHGATAPQPEPAVASVSPRPHAELPAVPTSRTSSPEPRPPESRSGSPSEPELSSGPSSPPVVRPDHAQRASVSPTTQLPQSANGASSAVKHTADFSDDEGPTAGPRRPRMATTPELTSRASSPLAQVHTTAVFPVSYHMESSESDASTEAEVAFSMGSSPTPDHESSSGDTAPMSDIEN